MAVESVAGCAWSGARWSRNPQAAAPRPNPGADRRKLPTQGQAQGGIRQSRKPYT